MLIRNKITRTPSPVITQISTAIPPNDGITPPRKLRALSHELKLISKSLLTARHQTSCSISRYAQVGAQKPREPGARKRYDLRLKSWLDSSRLLAHSPLISSHKRTYAMPLSSRVTTISAPFSIALPVSLRAPQ